MEGRDTHLEMLSRVSHLKERIMFAIPCAAAGLSDRLPERVYFLVCAYACTRAALTACLLTVLERLCVEGGRWRSVTCISEVVCPGKKHSFGSVYFTL